MPTRARWRVVIPVKPAALAKTRLGAAPALARALALDTISAVARAPGVAEVVVVTADRELRRELPSRVRYVSEREPAGIAAALARGAEGRSPRAPLAALLGDLPALQPSELGAALAIALGSARAFVRDADGSGTTLVTAAAGLEFEALFGPDSASAHVAAGFAELPIPIRAGLRRDVDTPEHLRALEARLGARTRAALGEADARLR